MQEETMERKNLITIKLLHYFITEQNYNPVLLQGAEDEIWLENLSSDNYKIVRIVSNYIHNNEQLDFDIFKTKRIVQRIKKKTFSFNMNVLSIYTDLGDNATLRNAKNIDCISLFDETSLKDYDLVETAFPDIDSKMKFNEDGLQLFIKITNDINRKNRKDQEKAEEVFKPKKPYITYLLVLINAIIFLGAFLTNNHDNILDRFCLYGPNIRIYQEYYRLLTGMFLHVDILHLSFNCYTLYVIGSQLESFMGRTKYLIIYIVSGLFASLLSITLSTNPSVGASGAIFGLMGSLLYFGYHYRVYLGNVLKSQIIPLILFNLLYGFMLSGIDNAAHIGGLIGGILITYALGVKYKSSTFEMFNGWVVTILAFCFLIYTGIVLPH